MNSRLNRSQRETLLLISKGIGTVKDLVDQIGEYRFRHVSLLRLENMGLIEWSSMLKKWVLSKAGIKELQRETQVLEEMEETTE